MAYADTPRGLPAGTEPPGTEPSDLASSDLALPEPSREPSGPSYDRSRENYTGISSGGIGDIEDVEHARALAEMIVDTVREGLLVLDFDLRIVAANESFYHTFDVKPEETLGRRVYELGEGQWDIPALRELLEDVLPREQVFNGFEVEHTFERIGLRYMVLNARRLNDHQLVLLAIEDATDRRGAEDRRLTRAVVMAEQEERRRLAYVLHEDLQQVLFGAKMSCHRGDVERVEALLEDAINLTRRLSHELAPPLLRGGDVGELVHWMAGRSYEFWGITVEARVAGELDVAGDEVRVLLYQLLRELLYNVAKHADVDRARLVAEQTDEGVLVRVEDRGVGFDVHALEHGGRSSFGLSSVRDRLERSGGRFTVESEPGRGTRVTLLVPAGPRSEPSASDAS